MEEVPLLLTLLDKSIRQHGLYGPHHPLASGSLLELDKRLRTFLDKGEALLLTIKRGAVEWKEQEVFVLDKRENNYLQEMYIDGVRTLEFLATVTADELRALISVLARDLKQYESREDDTVTLLWKQNFQNLRYHTVDIYSGDLNALLRETLALAEDEQTEERDYLKRFIHDLVEPNQDLASTNAGTAPIRQLVTELATETILPIQSVRFSDSPDSNEQLKAAALKSSNRNVLPELLDVFAETLEAKVDDPAWASMVKTFLAVVKDALVAGDISMALQWLKTLKEIQEFAKAKSKTATTEMTGAVDSVLSEEFFTGLAEQFATSLPSTPDIWCELFEYLEPNAARAVCAFLRHLTSETVRSSFVTFLVERIPPRTEIYIQHLKAAEWMLVRDMIKVVGQLPPSGDLMPALRHVAIHPVAAIRLEVIRSIRTSQNEIAQDILIRALNDVDADVRKTAIQAIGKGRFRACARPIADTFRNEKFLARELTEKKLFSVALARCSGPAAIDFFKQVLDADETGQEHHDLRIAALYGLADIDDSKALKILYDVKAQLFGNRELKALATELCKRRIEASQRGNQ